MLYRVTVETEVDGRQYTTELSLPNLLTVVNVASRWARVPQSFARQYHTGLKLMSKTRSFSGAQRPKRF